MTAAIQEAGPLVSVSTAPFGPEGMQSVAVTFKSIQLTATTDATPVQQVGAVKLVPSICPEAKAGCRSGKRVYVNSGISRASFWISDTQLAPGNPASTPQIDFEIHFVQFNCGEIVATGAIQSGTQGRSGLVIQVAGLLCDQVEFWARARSDTGLNPPYGNVTLTIHVIIDRLPGAGDTSATAPQVQVIEGAIIVPAQ